MSRPFGLLLGAIVGIAACSTTPGEPAPVPAEVPEAAPALTAAPANFAFKVDQHLRTYGHNWPSFHYTGVVGVYQSGEPVLERAYGYADLAARRPNEVDTPFALGTLSGPLTATAALRLSEREMIDLHASVTKYVPTFPVDVTVEQLLSHTAGLGNYTTSTRFDDFKKKAPAGDDILEQVVRSGTEFEAGTDHNPSNSNYAVLGLVIEAATGKPYPDVVRDEVLDPLEMRHTTWGRAPGAARGLAYNEAEYLETVDGVEPTAFGAAGGWTSTARDVSRFVTGLGDDEFLPPTLRRTMLGDNASGHGFSFTAVGVAGRSGHAWPGFIDGFNSAILWVPDDELVVVALNNSEVLGGGTISAEIASLFYGIEPPAREEPRPVPIELETVADVAGTYVLSAQTRHELEVGQVEPDKIRAMSTVFVSVGEHTLEFEVPGHGRKRMHAADASGKVRTRFFFKDAPGTKARFVRGGKAAPNRLWIEQGAMRLKYKAVEPTNDAKVAAR